MQGKLYSLRILQDECKQEQKAECAEHHNLPFGNMDPLLSQFLRIKVHHMQNTKAAFEAFGEVTHLNFNFIN